MKLPPIKPNPLRTRGASWGLAIEAIRRIQTITGTEGAVETALKMLRDNGRVIEDRIDYTFVGQIARLMQNALPVAPEINVSPSIFMDVEGKTKLKRFVQACEALQISDFGEELRNAYHFSDQTKRGIAAHLNVSRHCICNWQLTRSKFPTNMTPTNALELDSLLSSDGWLIAAYVATSQHSAFRFKKTVADALLKQNRFGQVLREYLPQSNLSIVDLLKTVEVETEIRISESLFTRWRCGLAVPRLDKEDVICAIDKLCNADRKIFEAWRDANPRPVYSVYRFSIKDWPPKLVAELNEILAARKAEPLVTPKETCNEPEDLLSEGVPPGKNMKTWREATKQIFIEFAEQFFGYLRLSLDELYGHTNDIERPNRKTQFQPQDLSFTLFCDFQFVHDYFEFLRNRAQRLDYTMSELNRTKTLLTFYRKYFPSQEMTAKEIPYWDAILNGKEAESKVQMKTWQEVLDEAVSAAWNFIRREHFQRQPCRSRVQPFLDSEVEMWAMAAEIRKRIEDLPLQVLSIKTAIEMRKLAIAAVLWARCFRPATILSLNLTQIFTTDDRVEVDINPEQFKNDGKGGSEGGEKGALPAIGWFFTAIRRWRNEGRPFLVRHRQTNGGEDKLSFFTGARFGPAVNAKKQDLEPGAEISAKTLYHDIVSVHGYPPYGQRYLFASAAWIANASIEEIAATLKNTVKIASNFYTEATEQQKTTRSNRAFAAFLAAGG